MIAIQSPEVKAACLLALIDQTDRGELEQLLGAGHSPKTLDELRQLSSTELSRMSKGSALKVYADVDPLALDKAIQGQRMIKSYDQDLTYFVTHGASLSMLRKYFTGDEKLIDYFREILMTEEESKGGKSLGRTKLPTDTALRDAIHQAAAKVANTSGAAKARSELSRSQLIELHKDLRFQDLRLDALVAVLNEFK